MEQLIKKEEEEEARPKGLDLQELAAQLHDELEQEEHIAELAALPHSDNEFAERSGTLG